MGTEASRSVQLMNLKLEAKYLQLEKSRNRLLDELEGLDDDLLNTPAAGGKWSIAQHIAHLLLVDKKTMQYVQHKLAQQDKLRPAALSHSVRSLLLKLALHSGKRYKAPPVVADVPDRAALPELRQEWDDIRFRLEDVLTDIPPQHLDKCLFRHPNAGPLTISQTLTFLQDHFNHHHRAIYHLKRQLVS